MALINSEFKPAWWLKGGHLQTIYPTLTRKKIKLAIKNERLELPDTDFIDLSWVGTRSQQIVLVLHGLGGSIASPYVQGILKAITLEGWQGVLMHFRGCSHEPNRLPRSYHSGETQDLFFVVNEIRKRFPHSQLAIVGYSLGANVLLKWLGELGSLEGVNCAVAVSVPFELHKVANRLRSGFSQIYQWWLLRKLKNDLLIKFSQLNSPIELDQLKSVKTFWDFDHLITAPLHGFASVQDYYDQSSSRQYLNKIQTPTLILHAEDDPFTCEDAIPKNEELSSSINLELSPSGGHVGFIAGERIGTPHYWLEDRIPAYLKEHLL